MAGDVSQNHVVTTAGSTAAACSFLFKKKAGGDSGAIMGGLHPGMASRLAERGRGGLVGGRSWLTAGSRGGGGVALGPRWQNFCYVRCATLTEGHI